MPAQPTSAGTPTGNSPADLAGSTLELLNRAVEFTFYNQSPTSKKYFETGVDSTVVTDLRVQFEIRKNLGREPNSCTVTVTNMSKDTRGRLEKKPVYAILRAGHNGVLHPLFAGSVSYARSDFKGTDWETKAQFADGGRSFSNARLSKSYPPSTTARRVLTDIAASMNLPIPSDLANATGLDQAISGPLTVAGPSRDAMTRLLLQYGYSWSTQDGRLQILKDGLPNARTSWVIDVDAGMIGSPEGSVPHKPGGVSELAIEVLLFPEIQPGDTISVTSRYYEGGLFRVNDVTHTGDTHGDDWKTALKATPLGSPPPKRGRRK
jgi:hypothetical protein